jgi:hypothetical protein
LMARQIGERSRSSGDEKRNGCGIGGGSLFSDIVRWTSLGGGEHAFGPGARTTTRSAGPSHLNPLSRRMQRHDHVRRRRDDAHHVRGPGVEGMTLFGGVLVLVIDLVQPRLAMAET